MSHIGRYEVRSELGRGGFGSVHCAWDPVMRRQVAIKLLTAVSDSSLLARFRNEAGTTGNLRHPNIITVYDYGEHEGQPYLVMELLEGRTLKEIILGGGLSLYEKLRILTQMAEGLLYAHERGVIHRDIKPANLMLLADGTLKILDFGIARLVDQSRSFQTQTGFLMGTIEYLAPDQIQGADADILTDIFSYGVVSYELLSGKQPFRADQIGTVLYMVTHSEPPPLRDSMPDCPAALDTVVRTAMAKQRDQRYSSLRELMLDLAPIERVLRRQCTDEWTQTARQRVEAGDLDSGQALVQKALTLDPMHEAAQELRHLIQRQREGQARRQHVDEIVTAAEDHVAHRRIAEAIGAFENALQLISPESGSAKRSAIERQLADARRLWEDAKQSVELLRQARAARDRGDTAAAHSLAAKAASLDPAAMEAAELRDKLAAELERQRASAAVVAQVRESIRGHVAQNRFPDARELLAGALTLFPGEPSFEELSREVAASEAQALEAEARQKREREEEQARLADAERLRIEEARRLEEQRKREEQRKLEDDARQKREREEEQARLADAERRRIEEARWLEKQRKLEEQRKSEEEARQRQAREEQARLEEEERLRLEGAKRLEEKRKSEEEARQKLAREEQARDAEAKRHWVEEANLLREQSRAAEVRPVEAPGPGAAPPFATILGDGGSAPAATRGNRSSAAWTPAAWGFAAVIALPFIWWIYSEVTSPPAAQPQPPGTLTNTASGVTPMGGGQTTQPQSVDRGAEVLSLLTKGRKQLEGGAYDAALASFEEALRIEPGNRDTLNCISAARSAKDAEERLAIQDALRRAEQSYENGSYDEAIRAYQQVLKLQPNNPRAAQGLTRARKALAAENRTSVAK